jgi:hypothetical protein
LDFALTEALKLWIAITIKRYQKNTMEVRAKEMGLRNRLSRIFKNQRLKLNQKLLVTYIVPIGNSLNPEPPLFIHSIFKAWRRGNSDYGEVGERCCTSTHLFLDMNLFYHFGTTPR